MVIETALDWIGRQPTGFVMFAGAVICILILAVFIIRPGGP